MEHLCWDDLRVLLAIHRTGSLLRAGSQLGLSTSTTGRRVDALERALGYQLVMRGRAGTALEPAALRLIRLAQTFEHGLAAEQRDRGTRVGTVRVSVPEGMADIISKALIALQLDGANIECEVIGENRMADIAAREADIGIRLTRTASSVLVEKALVSLRFGLYASPDYLRRHLPSRVLGPDDAAGLSFVGLDSRWKQLPHEQWLVALGAVHFPFRSSAISAVIDAVTNGMGIAALVSQDARTAGLLRIEAPIAGPVQPLYLVYHSDLRKLPHIRAAVSAIDRYLKAAQQL